jgi:hypothetical protein
MTGWESELCAKVAARLAIILLRCKMGIANAARWGWKEAPATVAEAMIVAPDLSQSIALPDEELSQKFSSQCQISRAELLHQS